MNILVYGWYHQDNLGDELFMDAFRTLFPQLTFKFVNQICLSDVEAADAVFIGGGSFLGDVINVEDNITYEALKSKKILYIGIGTETEINIYHYELMRLAKLIAIRSPQHLEKALQINPNTIVIPDLVFCLDPSISVEPIDKSVLIIPNVNVVPQQSDPHWKHTAWEYFKSEFSQFLDELIIEGYTISFLSLCNNFCLDDSFTAAEIINHMMNRNTGYLLPKKNTLGDATEIISRYSAVITQRYHGIVLAEMLAIPCLSIVHHDKLKSLQSSSLSYYGITKDKLRNQFDQLLHTKVSQFLPIDRDMFVLLQQAVLDALGCDQRQQSADSIE